MMKEKKETNKTEKEIRSFIPQHHLPMHTSNIPSRRLREPGNQIRGVAARTKQQIERPRTIMKTTEGEIGKPSYTQ